MISDVSVLGVQDVQEDKQMVSLAAVAHSIQ
jgi:hypothetical protein